MSNTERITCDYAGCSKLFAYREKGFNLCNEHCTGYKAFYDRLLQGLKESEQFIIGSESD